MAQSQPSDGGAFYLPQRLVVQLGITEASPEGGVVMMEPGWYDASNLDERVLTNPVVKGLVPQESGQAGRNAAQAALNRKIANGEATPVEMDKLLQEQAQQQNEERLQQTEAWNGKAQDAIDKGQVFTEPHPDPAVNYARWISSPTPQYVAAGGMQTKIEPPINAPPITPTTTAQRPTVTPAAARPAAPEAH